MSPERKCVLISVVRPANKGQVLKLPFSLNLFYGLRE